MSGSGNGTRVEAGQYVKDVINLKKIMNELYRQSNYMSTLVAPGGFFNQDWYIQLLEDSGSDVVNIVTHSIYNLGAGMQLSYNADVYGSLIYVLFSL